MFHGVCFWEGFGGENLMSEHIVEYRKKHNQIYSEIEGHCHTFYEIYYFISGDADIMVEGNVYALSPHTLILLAPNVMHGIRVNSRADYVRDVLYFYPNDLMPDCRHLLTSILPPRKKERSRELIYSHAETFRLDSFYYNIRQLDDQPDETRSMLAPIFIEAFLSQIYIMAKALKPADLGNQLPTKTLEILNYVNAHLTERQTLEEIADHFFISKNYLNANFKKYLGTTVMDYVRYKRVTLAKQAIQAGESAMDAALQSGFSDYSSFYRAYVKYEGHSPRENLSEATLPFT